MSQRINLSMFNSMPDSAEQLQRLYLAGFDRQTFDRFPKRVGVVRNLMAVLVETEGRQVFQSKQETLEATPQRLEALGRFRADLQELLNSSWLRVCPRN